MEVAIVGLGKMGGNMARRLIGDGHRVLGFDRSPEVMAELASHGLVPMDHLTALPASNEPRVVWLMVPSGEPVDQCISEVRQILGAGDIIVDGGNSHYVDTLRRAASLASEGIRYMDAGTSGGIWGLEEGYCLMVGGSRDAVQVVEPLLKSLASEGGYLHVGSAGAGHYAKMV
ncbi:MAG: NAD(P)-binding domain-containing protein, partial [Bdellovibrionales bacterium]|nr:NAD(P)-binding domain-containing protein [Bdellovibrionales bacterium]